MSGGLIPELAEGGPVKPLDGASLRRREVEAMEAHAKATVRCAVALERVADALWSDQPWPVTVEKAEEEEEDGA